MHKERLKNKYYVVLHYAARGKELSEEDPDNLLGGGKANILEGRPNLIMQNKEMQKELEKI